MGSRRRGSASSTLPGKRKMEIHLALMMLLATGVLAQDDDAAAQPVCDKDCEESWQYVEFLKNDINGNITEILTNFKTTQDGDKAVTKTMEKVMEVRESILTRIKDIRKEEIEVCFGHNVKQEEKLSEFRMDIMAILLKLVDLDANSVASLREVGDALIAFRLKISTECMEPPMFAMELIGANGDLDDAIADLYTEIIESTDETVRTESLDMLTMLKEQREKIDVHISNLLEEDDPEKIKKYVTSTMRGDILNIKIKYEDCLEANCKGTSPPCESCGADKVDEMREKMREYSANLESQREDEDKKEFIREDLITYINRLNGRSSALLREKVNKGELGECEQEELKVIDDCKGPMWMLVNTTIFESVESVAAMVSVMDDELKSKRGDYCNTSDDPPAPPTTNCDWEEYENSK